MLNKNDVLYDRDEKGKVIPIEVEVEVDETDDEQLNYKGETVKVIPMSRGKIKRIFSEVREKSDEEKDFDGDIICEHCYEPTISPDEVKHLRPVLATIIVNTIFRESGLKSGKNRMKEFLRNKGLLLEYEKFVKKKTVDEAEDDFAKN